MQYRFVILSYLHFGVKFRFFNPVESFENRQNISVRFETKFHDAIFNLQGPLLAVCQYRYSQGH